MLMVLLPLSHWPVLSQVATPGCRFIQVSISPLWEKGRVDLVLKQSRKLSLLQGFQPASQESQGYWSSEF